MKSRSANFTSSVTSSATSSATLPFASPRFWSTFARGTWEKKTAHFEKVGKSLSATMTPAILKVDDGVIFSLLVRYCDRCRETGLADGIKFYRGGVRLESFETLEYLPEKSDGSLQGYNRRMEEQFDDYGLVCDELMQIEHPLWSEVRSFMKDLYDHVGLPNRFSEIGLYLGNYKKTPFGVHVDKCGVFSFPVVGSKKFRLWTSEFVAAHPELEESFSYDEFKKQSIVLKAKPGDVTYWPSSYWHIAENDGSFNATWSIGIWVDKPVREVVTEALQPLLEKTISTALGRAATKKALAFDESLPPEFEQAAGAIANLSKAEIRNVLNAWWTRHSRSAGFKRSKTRRR